MHRRVSRRGSVIYAAGVIGIYVSLTSLSPQAAESQALSTQLIAYNCFSCHGEAGVSKTRSLSLKGLPAAYLTQALRDYQAGTRPGTVMPRLAKGYTEAELLAVARYFAALK
jgi:cytochrome subunit of sulfide dehydrogenase